MKFQIKKFFQKFQISETGHILSATSAIVLTQIKSPGNLKLQNVALGILEILDLEDKSETFNYKW